MNLKFAILLAFLFAVAHSSKANVIYVDSAHVGGIQNGNSWATAFSNLQNGIDAASSGDSVWVTYGTYLVDSAHSYTFKMKEGVKIFGDFENTFTTFSQRNTSNLNFTTLKGSIYNSVISNIDNNLSAAAVIDGFTITNGHNVWGAGMVNYHASPSISNCIFVADSLIGASVVGGGAIYNYGNHCVISQCQFSNNWISAVSSGSGYGGGAIYNDSANVSISYSNFTANRTDSWLNTTSGGAIYNNNSTLTLFTCNFQNNVSSYNGGAIMNTGASTCNISVSFFDSNISSLGGAIFNAPLSTLNIKNVSFTGNYANNFVSVTGDAVGGGAIYNTSVLSIDSSYFNENSAGNGSCICNYNSGNVNIGHSMFWQNNCDGWGSIFNFNTVAPINITTCHFYSNNAGRGGSIANVNASKCGVANCLFSKNVATFTGGGVIYNDSSYTKIVNSTIVQNKSTSTIPNDNAGAISNLNHGKIDVSNSIIWGNATGIQNLNGATTKSSYSLIQEMPADGLHHNWDGGINPLFEDTATGHYRLNLYSVCINTGRNDSLANTINNDLYGSTRIFDGTIDLGAYEYTSVLAPTVNLGNDTSFCLNNIPSITLVPPYLAYASYTWNTGDTGRFLTVNTTGDYSVSITNQLGTASDTIRIVANAAPVVPLPSDTTMALGDSLMLDAGNAGSTYLWSTGSTNQIIYVRNTGTYTVMVTNSNGCSASDSIKVSFNATAISKVNNTNHQWSISPNPTTNIININLKDPQLLHTTAILSDAYGRVVKTISIDKKAQSISLAGLANGLYILKMENGESIKVVKE